MLTEKNLEEKKNYTVVHSEWICQLPYQPLPRFQRILQVEYTSAQLHNNYIV